MDRTNTRSEIAPGAALSADQVRALVPNLGRAACYAWIREKLPFYAIGKKLYVHRVWVDVELLGLESRRIHAAMLRRFGKGGLVELVQELERLLRPQTPPPGGDA